MCVVVCACASLACCVPVSRWLGPGGTLQPMMKQTFCKVVQIFTKAYCAVWTLLTQGCLKKTRRTSKHIWYQTRRTRMGIQQPTCVCIHSSHIQIERCS